MKNWNKFLEAIREDEYSHLNDKLNDKLTDDPAFDYLNDDSDDYRGEEGDMKHLINLLTTMFKNSGIEAEVEYKDLDIMIYIVMNEKERLKDIINVFEVGAKLKKDILPQYISEVVMWETKSGDPMIALNFMYDDGTKAF